MYTVKGIKTFTGMEGIGYNCGLYKGNKKVAEVTDPATGGPIDFYWTDMGKQPRVSMKQRGFDETEFDRPCTPFEKEFLEFIAENGDGSWMADEMWISNAVNAALQEKEYKKWCRQGTVFRLRSDKPGTWGVLKQKWTKAVSEALKKRHGDELEEILNERFA